MAQQSGVDAAVQLQLPEPRADAASYAVFDLETTGLDAAVHQIIEIGWCTVRDELVGPPRSLLVACDQGVPAEIETLTGISAALLARDGVTLAAALTAFLEETRGLPLVGHNVLRFDMPFLEAACRVTGLAPPSRHRYRDTAALYKAQRLGLTLGQGQDHWSFALEALARPAPGLRYALPVCCRQLGIALDGVRRHRAAGDVLITQQLYARLMADQLQTVSR